MKSPRVLVNCANVRSGGALQVASSLLDEFAAAAQRPDLAKRYPWLTDGLTVLASPAVLANCTGSVAHLAVESREGTFDFAARRRQRVDVSFTVFGPEYVPLHSDHHIVGFADGVSLWPEMAPMTGREGVVRSRARRFLSKARFRQAQTIVVEADHVGHALTERWGVPAERIRVVPNAVNGVFRQEHAWEDVVVPPAEGDLVCFITRAYPHKNLEILGPVAAIMRDLHRRPVRFVLTLREDEWMSLPDQVRQCAVNVGPVSIRQVPSIYRQSRASIFPSLLEAFSATPLEALAMGTPLVASDRPFVRSTCGDAPIYADPTDPASLAGALATALNDELTATRHVRRGLAVAAERPSAADRALLILEEINGVLAS